MPKLMTKLYVTDRWTDPNYRKASHLKSANKEIIYLKSNTVIPLETVISKKSGRVMMVLSIYIPPFPQKLTAEMRFNLPLVVPS